jgi:hypothetical protein
MQVPGDKPYHRLVPCLGLVDSKEFEQGVNVILIPVRVLAAESAHRIILVRLEICRAGVQPIGMLLHPRTGDIVLT